MTAKTSNALRAGQLVTALLVALVWGGAARAGDDIAQSSLYGADTLTFERWCGEIQHFDEARCESRTAADVANYQLAKDKLSTYEIQYDKQRRRDQEFNDGFALYQHPDVADPLK